ncbi:MAG: hypothetical protein J6K46_00300 [Sutterella sp.]|nr:hypothetical protein [Sutterella sp.]
MPGDRPIRKSHIDFYGNEYRHVVTSLGGGRYRFEVVADYTVDLPEFADLEPESYEGGRDMVFDYWREREDGEETDVLLQLFYDAGDAAGISELMHGDVRWLLTPAGRRFLRLHNAESPAKPQTRLRAAASLTCEQLEQETDSLPNDL